jgi:hypothetical protein
VLDSVDCSPAGAFGLLPFILRLAGRYPILFERGYSLWPGPTPAIVATWHTKIRHLAYALRPASEPSPSKSNPAFVLPSFTNLACSRSARQLHTLVKLQPRASSLTTPAES